MKTYEKVFNSKQHTGLKEFQLANGYISTTEIFFEEENVIAVIEASGKVDLTDCDGNLIASAAAPEEDGGKKVYTEVLCGKEGGQLIFKFPIVEWIDNYPNCDGEYDRWDSRIIGYNTVTFDC